METESVVKATSKPGNLLASSNSSRSSRSTSLPERKCRDAVLAVQPEAWMGHNIKACLEELQFK